jgi:hypothetical protein
MTPKLTNEEKRKAALAEWEKNKYYKIKTKKGNPAKKDEMKEDDG